MSSGIFENCETWGEWLKVKLWCASPLMYRDYFDRILKKHDVQMARCRSDDAEQNIKHSKIFSSDPDRIGLRCWNLLDYHQRERVLRTFEGNRRLGVELHLMYLYLRVRPQYKYTDKDIKNNDRQIIGTPKLGDVEYNFYVCWIAKFK
jgi:hypothetical protein